MALYPDIKIIYFKILLKGKVVAGYYFSKNIMYETDKARIVFLQSTFRSLLNMFPHRFALFPHRF